LTPSKIVRRVAQPQGGEGISIGVIEVDKKTILLEMGKQPQ